MGPTSLAGAVHWKSHKFKELPDEVWFKYVLLLPDDIWVFTISEIRIVPALLSVIESRTTSWNPFLLDPLFKDKLKS